MAAQGMRTVDVAEIIKKSPSTTSDKINGKVEWKYRETLALTKYFLQFYPNLTSDKLFSDVELSTIVDDGQKGA